MIWYVPKYRFYTIYVEISLRIYASLGKGIGNVVDYGNTGCGGIQKLLEFGLDPCLEPTRVFLSSKLGSIFITVS